MRKTLLFLLAAIGLGAVSVEAQGWQTQLGLQGGFVRVKPAGTGRHDQTDAFLVPGFNLGPAFPAPNSLYMIVPVSPKVALEPSLAGAFLATGTSASVFQAGLRVDYAIASGLYGAGGALLGHISDVGYEAGLQLAGGYRFHLTGPVQARLEANVQTWKGKARAINPINTYGLLFGISARL